MKDTHEMNDPHIEKFPNGAFYWKNPVYGGKWRKWDGPAPRYATLRYKRGKFYVYRAHGMWFSWRW